MGGNTPTTFYRPSSSGKQQRAARASRWWS